MNNEKLDNLFGEIRNEATETSVKEVSKWIAISATSVGLFGLLSQFKLPLILTKKIIIMTTLAITIGIGATALFLSANTASTNDTPHLNTAKIEVKQPTSAGEITSKPVDEKVNHQNPDKPTEEGIEIATLPLLATKPLNDEATLQLKDLQQFPPIIHQATIDGNEIKVGDFNQVHVSGALDVYISQGDKASVIVDGTAEEIASVVAKVNRGELHLKQKSNTNNDNNSLKIHITMVDITGFGVSGAASITSTMTIKVPQMDIQATGAGNMELQLECDHIKVEATGASNVDLTGKTKTMVIEATGACNLDCTRLNASEVDLVASGASNVDCKANDRLYINATGASNVTYRGMPKDLSKNASISSKISKRL